ncbi:tRNA1(Val) (adenine(37)-N6)-methyltransferase [Shewanella youngdeokensis]|uniref:tRNA1(Val) (adenine(37)-N6)-methyltransferase n=1 Tax=Shewanella youngdeokensis TaxID=2999068 RepID=A0ABZ0K379_9GAMM|nr:methyltransferase [Shewanella sp. DAU334]
MSFSFKQFHITDTRCGMPVSTDGVLLGAWAPLTHAKSVLDIGAGSGLLSLMAAQRCPADITAIELDESAALDCQHNFNHSPWAERLSLFTGAVQQYSLGFTSAKFDHIICNPPYFDNGPQSSSKLRATARHTDSLGFSELLHAIKQLLNQTGLASLILPSVEARQLLSQLQQHQLSCQHMVAVASVEGKEPNRKLLLLSHENSVNTLCFEDVKSASTLAIRKQNGQYTDEFIQLTHSFYLKL